MTKRSSIEVEAKFRPIDDQTLSAIEPKRIFPGYRRGEPTEIETDDCYLDSRDYGLVRHGYSLRVRRSGDAYQITVKSLHLHSDPAHQRTEIEAPVPGVSFDSVDDWPEPIRRIVKNVLGKKPKLHVCCILKQARVKHHIFPAADGEGCAPLAELSYDTVRVVSAGKKATTFAPFHEIELELLQDGAKEEFAALVEMLERCCDLQSVHSSKYEQALPQVTHCDHQGRPIVFAPEMPMAEACRYIWRDELLAMVLNEAGVRYSNDIEYVHNMRVATRRARTAQRIFGAFFMQRAIRSYLQTLRQTAGRLGAVRDWDVALAALGKAAAKRPYRERKEAEMLVAYWQQKRQAAFVALLDWLDSKRYRTFVADFDHFLHRSGVGVVDQTYAPGESPVPTQVRHVMPSLILARFEAMRAYEPLFEKQRTPAVETYHALRIDAKRLRYSLEFVAPLLGTEGAQVIAQLKSLQQILGDLNDAVVQRVRLKMAIEAGMDNGFVRRYRKKQKKKIARQIEAFPSKWKGFIGQSNREMLLHALAQL